MILGENESIESGGCVLYQARNIIVVIGVEPNLLLFFGEVLWRFYRKEHAHPLRLM